MSESTQRIINIVWACASGVLALLVVGMAIMARGGSRGTRSPLPPIPNPTLAFDPVQPPEPPCGAGDTCSLMSGGIPMTVMEYHPAGKPLHWAYPPMAPLTRDHVSVVWMDEQNRMRHDSLPLETLIIHRARIMGESP